MAIDIPRKQKRRNDKQGDFKLSLFFIDINYHYVIIIV